MPIVTNYEFNEFRKMHLFACKLVDLVDSIDGNNGISYNEAVQEIADKLEIKLPVEEPDH
jgi:DNA primase